VTFKTTTVKKPSHSHHGTGLAKHQAWLAALPCPVLRLDGTRPLPELVAEVRAAIDG
jgi:hypothetical protein